jgi:hypothetical protein
MWGVIAVAVVSGLVQAYNSAQARGANKAELNKIKASFDAIVPPEFDVSINDAPAFITEKLQGANLDFSKLTPEQFKTVGTYAPEAAKYVAEANPTLVKGTAASKEGRQAQIEALRGYKQIASGENPELRAAMEDAGRAAQQQAQSRSQSLLQDAQRRGDASSGLSYASMLQGNSDAMNQGAANSREAAIQGYKAKLEALQQSGTMGRNLANDELSQEQANANIINDFNQRTSKNYQAYLQNRSELSNQAQMYNLQAQQATSDKNTALQNENNRFNLQNQNQLAQQQYGNQRDERNYQNSLAAQQAQWAASEKARQNELKQTTFNNQTQIANGRAGIGAQQIQMNNQSAADKNNVVSGIAQGAAGAYAANQEDERWNKYFALQKARG